MRRTGDSWGVTESVGATALAVAGARALEHCRDDRLFEDPLAELFLVATGDPMWIAVAQGDLSLMDTAAAIEYEPSIAAIAARTRYFDDVIEEAAGAGIGQFVLLAAGLDARAYRLKALAAATVYEVDLPRVLEFKAEALDGQQPVGERRTVAVDLRDAWPAALRQAGFDPSAPTLWLIEGLLRYLPLHDQKALLHEVTALSAPGSWVTLNDWPVNTDPTDRMLQIWDKIGAGDVRALTFTEESDPGHLLADQGWEISLGNLLGILDRHTRAITDKTRRILEQHVLLTAVRPQPGDQSS
ncbi:SAM-dependent methyltransferase [Nocardia brasiliensis]|uniref:SAM-dependent methyltransferase n=1 Tax=Nocardia brasiliensis TaxID=37326 RepID=UPI003671545F